MKKVLDVLADHNLELGPFDKPGPLTFICHFPQHEAYGMVGVVMVKP